MNIVGKYERSSLDIGGSAESLLELSRAIRELVGSEVYSLPVPLSPPTPYIGYAKSLKLEAIQGNVCVSRTGDEIAICGSPEKLAILARNIGYLAEQQSSDDRGEHLHIEYYPGHFYLSAESLPMVVTKRADFPESGEGRRNLGR
jgi:hypothetical protein